MSFVFVMATGAVRAQSIDSTKAPSKAAAGSQRGVVSVEEATVFKDANFDSEVLEMAPQGRVFEMSLGKRDGFYRVRLKPGTTAWISEGEIQAQGTAEAPAAEAPLKKETKKKQSKKTEDAPLEPRKKRKSMEAMRFRGFSLESVNYAESTMGALRHETLLTYGFRVSGPNTLFTGDMPTDLEIMVHPSAPSYYATQTGNSTSGFLLMGNFLFLTQIPESKTMMFYYGFGPSLRYSTYRVTLGDAASTNQKSYDLSDMTLGAVFGAGLNLMLGDQYALRLDGRYYWESERYFALGLAIQKEF